MPSLGSGPFSAVPRVAGTGVSRYSYSVDRYRLSSYMPPIADRLADTAAWPWRNSIRYIVIWPRVMRPTIVVMAIQPPAAYSVTVPIRPRPKPQPPRRLANGRAAGGEREG